jgi:carboxymethylenebutenolidase
MARVLASEGYQVFAIDLYGEVATTPEKAREFSTAVRANPEAAVAKMKLATAYLKNAQAPKVASLGWCFGGQQSLNLSLAEKLDATVIYYGNLVTDKTKLATISQPVLGIFWETDTSVKVESVKEFDKSLDELGIKNDINIYPGVGHAFANPTGANFSKPETLDAWEKTVEFLEENLK